jgi:hypothetical protein
VKYQSCSYCKKLFWAHALPNAHLSTICSDLCYITVKKKNATGIKRCYYKGCRFDSKWEVELATLLDKRNISWVVPRQSISWVDSTGKKRKYFPDFFLPDYNVYLDPKNPIVIKIQQEKLNAVTKLISLLYGKPSEILARLEGVEPT